MFRLIGFYRFYCLSLFMYSFLCQLVVGETFSLTFRSFYLNYFLHKSSAAMRIFSDNLMIMNVLAEKVIVYRSNIFSLRFFLVKVVINSHVHYICEVVLVTK